MSETINQRIARFRKLAGYSQEDMAYMLDLKTGTYRKRELNGKIDCEFLINISELLDIDIKILLFGEEATNGGQKDNNVLETDKPEVNIRYMSDINRGFFTALNSISSSKRIAIYRLIQIVLNNKQLDIVSIVEEIEKNYSNNI